MANLVKFNGKAPEVIKAQIASGSGDIFFDSGNDWEPLFFDTELLSENYGDQIFTDVVNQKNIVVLPEAVTGDCLLRMNDFINYTP